MRLPSNAQVQTALAEKSLGHFIRQAWHVAEPGYDFIPGWHIDAISDHLEAVTRGELRRLIINIPPRHMKSIQCAVMWPSWAWIPKPEMRWLFATYAQTLSTRDSVKCRRLIESPWYQSRWGDRYQLTEDQNQKTRYENDKTGYRLAASVGGAMTGEGGDIIVIDDPHNAQDVWSDAIRTNTLDWWDTTMSTRLNDKKKGAYVIIMQRLHESDLVGHILSRETGWDHLCLPAEYERNHPYPIISSLGFCDPRKTEAELLWPAREGQPEVDETKRRLGSMAAAGQLQQRPAPAEGGMFKRAWWKFYNELPEDFSVIIQSWDMAFKESKDTDFVAGLVLGKRGPDVYVFPDQFHARADFVKTQEAVKTMTRKHPKAAKKLIEEKANGAAIIASLKTSIGGFKPINPKSSKVARAQAVSPYVESGNVYLPNPDYHSWVHDFIEELALFPNGQHDDWVDALSQALNELLSKPEIYIGLA